MAEIKDLVFRVLIWEMDRWSGRKLDETKHFDNKPEAEDFVRKFNSKNTEAHVPDWYMYAELG